VRSAVAELSSIELATFNSSIARFGSLRSKATPARIVGNQYLCASVSSGKVCGCPRGKFENRLLGPTNFVRFPEFQIANFCGRSAVPARKQEKSE
jgi:hypothetical protein